MNRWEAIEIFNRLRDDAIVVHGTGGMGIEVNTKSPSDLNIYAPMPYPTPVGLGMALALPKQKIVITEGDGSALSYGTTVHGCRREPWERDAITARCRPPPEAAPISRVLRRPLAMRTPRR